MFSKRHGGFTLVEMVIAIVIISIGLAGVLMAFNTTVKSSADPMIRKQMLAVAEEMMEEILLKPYAAAPGTISGCNRASADDVFDYAAYTTQLVCDIDGTSVTGLESYRVTVSQVDENLTSIAGAIAPARKISVTVTVTGSSESLVLIGWRTDYAS